MNNRTPAQVGAKSDKGPVRSINEDAYWTAGIDDPVTLGALYIVADGVGGQEYGERAAQEAVQAISQSFYRQRQAGEAVVVALRTAIQSANRSIFTLAQEQKISKMGCTVVTAVQHDDHLYVAHVGDARAYLLAGNDLHRLTRDDTWVQRQLDAGVITPEQAANHEFRNVVTQVLGNKETVDVHLAQPRPLYSGDTVMLCSDGVHDPLPDAEIGSLLAQNAPQAAAATLVQTAIERGTKDNVTAVVVNCGAIPGRIRAAAGSTFWQNWPVPAWAPIVVAALVLLLLILFVILPLLFNQGVADETPPPTINSVATVPATPTSVIEVIAPTEPPAPTATATPMPLPTVTPVIVPTDAPAATTALPTATLLPSPTGESAQPPQRACIVGNPLFWSDPQIQSGECNLFANNYWFDLVESGEVIIIEDRRLRSPDSSCQEGIPFSRVESATDPTVIGWVLQSNLSRLTDPTAVCPNQ